MSKLLVIIFAAGLVLLGLRPIEENYGSFSAFAFVQMNKLADFSKDFSVEKWTNKLESRRYRQPESEYSVKPRRPLFPQGESRRASASTWFSRLLPSERKAAPRVRIEEEKAHSHTEALTSDDRKELDQLLDNF